MLHGSINGSVNATPPNLRCPRNGKTDECPANNFAGPFSFHHAPLRPCPRPWEGDESSSVSPDTGQQGEFVRPEKGHAFVTLMHWRGSR